MRIPVQRRRSAANCRAVSDLLPRSGTEKACRNRSLQAPRTDQMTVAVPGELEREFILFGV
jgi:hypothetical protein